MLKAICGLIFAISALAEGPVFDAASIKPAPPPEEGMMRVGSSGGPATSDPGLFKCFNCSISMLITQAYDIQRYQLTGPSSIDGDRFDVNAKVPEGATKEQFRLMLQNLLADRFKMTTHRDKKEMAAFELVVAKNGPKMKEAAPVDADAAPADLPPAPPGGLQRPEIGKDGFPTLPKVPGRPLTIMMPGRARTVATAVSMQDLAKYLTAQVGGKPVVDATGLKGKYDYTLTFAPDNNMGPGMMMPHADGGIGGAPPPSDNAETLPNIFTALQEQLGLKLEPRKSMVDTVIVDHIDKAPSDN